MTMNRRTFVIHSLVGSAALVSATLSQAQAAKVAETDAQAVALAYKEDATKTDKVKYPKYAAGQHCASCQLYAGGATGYGNCALFPGKQVAAAGWCSAYAKKA
ncbi:high-potential iron-sulfur protein [Actimicrobium sp. CCC2.4]|uniref:high-potential iron-sulfur protein n=1 Tax=Actimicrobium sp. CCC2.4 TaxID=3048606 RepID=UPI002AC9942F|nr:high-potential iron-sulfur protein [Actimicrobium sp. CCC2.4]MEB0136706.1 high-potential iron-sulfur protein [Actimicrobium sp. CCC2.4]WPX33171.1 high-potential iron-sulfur protein [Actimicrobium sp. CCC2.4]